MIDFGGFFAVVIILIIGLTVIVCCGIYFGFEFQFGKWNIAIKSGRLAFERSRHAKDLIALEQSEDDDIKEVFSVKEEYNKQKEEDKKKTVK